LYQWDAPLFFLGCSQNNCRGNKELSIMEDTNYFSFSSWARKGESNFLWGIGNYGNTEKKWERIIFITQAGLGITF